jgi:hypothetical protein
VRLPFQALWSLTGRESTLCGHLVEVLKSSTSCFQYSNGYIGPSEVKVKTSAHPSARKRIALFAGVPRPEEARTLPIITALIDIPHLTVEQSVTAEKPIRYTFARAGSFGARPLAQLKRRRENYVLAHVKETLNRRTSSLALARASLATMAGSLPTARAAGMKAMRAMKVVYWEVKLVSKDLRLEVGMYLHGCGSLLFRDEMG